MNTQAIAKQASTLLKKSGDFLHTNSPAIFAGIAIAGIISTTVMAVRATIKAANDIQEACYNDPDTDEYIEPDTKETIALVWKHYVPVVLMAGLTVGAVVTSHTIQSKRNAILAGLLTTSQKALEDYQTKTEEVVGKSKAEKIKEELAGDKLTKNPIDESQIIATGFGDSLCYDVLTDRYFKSNYDKVNQAADRFNYELIMDNNKPLNEFYSLLNIPSCGLGEVVGWRSDRELKLSLKSKLTSDGRPCLVIDYATEPSASFREWI